MQKPTLGRGPKFRDKRLTFPSLYIDLRDKIYKTSLWQPGTDGQPGKLILNDFDGRLASGEVFAGVMKISGEKETYVFDGTAIRVDFINKKLAATFEIGTPGGMERLRDIVAKRDPENKTPLPPILFSLAYRTVNWSLSGFLVGNYRGQLKKDQSFTGMIRLEKSQKSGFFRAEVRRFVSDCKGMAAEFTKFTPEAFELFEIAMKRSERGPQG